MHLISEILKDQNAISNHIHHFFHASMSGGAFHEPFEYADLPKLDNRLQKRKVAGMAISTLNSANLAASGAAELSEADAVSSVFGVEGLEDPAEEQERLNAFSRDCQGGKTENDPLDIKSVVQQHKEAYTKDQKAPRPAVTSASVYVLDDDELDAAVRAFGKDAIPPPVAVESRQEEIVCHGGITRQEEIDPASAHSRPKPELSVSESMHLRAFMTDVISHAPREGTPKALRACRATSRRPGTEEDFTQQRRRVVALRLPSPATLPSSQLNTETCKTYVLEWLKNNCSTITSSPDPPAFTINYLQRIPRLRLLIGRVVKKAVDQKLRKTGRASTESPNLKMARVLKTTVASLWRNGSIVHASQAAQRKLAFPFNGRSTSTISTAPSSTSDISCSWGGTVAELFSDKTLENDELLPPSSGAASSVMEIGATPAPSQDCDNEDLPDLDASAEAYQLVTPSLILEEVRSRYTLPDRTFNMHELLRQDACRLAQRLQRSDERWKNLRVDSVQELLDALSEGSILL